MAEVAALFCLPRARSISASTPQGADDVQTQHHISYREQKQGQNHSII